MIEAKRVPYGVSDFLRVIRENQYYVDKTMYIPLLEAQPDYLIFIRPRRFGKSLFLSMLEAYYDCKLKDQFQEIFGADRQVSVCREISKVHEESVRGTLQEVVAHFTATEPRGEIVIILAGKEK